MAAEKLNISEAEAIKEMMEGKKVRHAYFSANEWVRMTASGFYEFEDGVICSPAEFWKHRVNAGWLSGWSVVD